MTLLLAVKTTVVPEANRLLLGRWQASDVHRSNRPSFWFDVHPVSCQRINHHRVKPVHWVNEDRLALWFREQGGTETGIW